MKHFGKLTLETPGDRQIVMTRILDAPRELVFEAFTRPELVKRWLIGPDGWSMPVCEIDLRVGGAYRYVWHGPNGEAMGMGGVYREVVSPERIVATEKFDESWYPGEGVDTTVFTEERGKTTVVLTVEFESKEARAVALQSGMERGVSANYDRLEEMMATALKSKTA
jgi:uncharacterized protein YndB with AHSA1/START domain